MLAPAIAMIAKRMQHRTNMAMLPVAGRGDPVQFPLQLLQLANPVPQPCALALGNVVRPVQRRPTGPFKRNQRRHVL